MTVKRARWSVACICVVICLISVLPKISGASEVRDKVALDIMNEATKNTVKQTGVQAVGVGSWISQQNYRSPLAGGRSDHDMRVVMMGETDAGKMANGWKEFQKNLSDNIRVIGKQKGLTDAEINSMIKSTNVYPPKQLMEGVEDVGDAVKKFNKLGGNPSLGNEPIEGLWGKGSGSYTQTYEAKAGKFYYVDRQTGKVVTGSTDLTHLEEGLEKFTTAGEVNKGIQWAEKALEKIEGQDPQKAAKYVERLRQSVNKARSMERVGMRADYLDDIISGRIQDPTAVREAVDRAQRELNLLGKLSTEANAHNRELLKGILNKNLGKWAKIRGAFWKYAGKVPTDKLLRGIQLYMYYARVNDVSKLAGEDFNAAVLKAFPELGYLAGLVPGLAMDVAVSVLEAGRAGAYNIVTAFQECTTMLEGISTVKGRENIGSGMTIEQMAARYTDTADDLKKMDAFIWYQAQNASYREEGGRPVSDPRIAETLYQKCKPQIFSKWQEQRLAWIEQFNRYYVEFNGLMGKNMPVIYVSPSEVIPLKDQGHGQKAAGVTVSGSTAENAARIQDLVQKMAGTLKSLEGNRGQVLFTSERYTLSVDGRNVGSDYRPLSKSFTYSSPGNHSAGLVYESTLTGTYVSGDVGEHSLLGGYRKVFPGSTATSFSIVEEGARATLKVAGPARVKVKQGFTVTASVQDSNVPANNVFIAWANQGSGQRFGGYSASLTTSQAAPGQLHLIVEAFMRYNNQYVKLADARHTVIVEDDEKKPEKKPDEKKPGITPPTSPTTPTQAQPLKKFEELNEKERQNLLDCLCKASSTANQSMVGVSYDPKPRDSSPHCAQASNGPCVNQGYGCWRHFPDGGSKGAQDCYQRAGVTGAAPNSVRLAGKGAKDVDEQEGPSVVTAEVKDGQRPAATEAMKEGE